MRWLIIIVIVLVLIIAAVLLWKKPSINNNLPTVTTEELSQGWYYGEKNAKRPGTPETWQHELSGTRSARWYDPEKNKTN